jgi:uncharacterized protein (TIGR02246 family)
MNADEQAIHGVFAAWHAATTAGDVAALRELMDEDVVFLVAGQPPMRGRDAFAAAFRLGLLRQRIEYTWVNHEIRIDGNCAVCWNQLAVTVTPLQGGPTRRLAGPTLTVLRRRGDGSWVLLRDANLLAPDAASIQQ